MTIETILSPLELPALAQRDLRSSACVVFDILRATSTFVTALQNGAKEIIPVSEISEAVAFKKAESGPSSVAALRRVEKRKVETILLAGERDGVRIRAAQSGGLDFDFGNSPREFTPEKVRGQTIVSTTTNGTRALQACKGAECVLASSFLNLAATAEFLRRKNFTTVVLVCAGTGEGVADEDVLAAGALVEILLGEPPLTPALSPPRGEGEKSGGRMDDSSQLARETFLRMKTNLAAAIGGSQNGRRLLANPELRDDVAFCAQRDVCNLVAVMGADGALRRVGD